MMKSCDSWCPWAPASLYIRISLHLLFPLSPSHLRGGHVPTSLLGCSSVYSLIFICSMSGSLIIFQAPWGHRLWLSTWPPLFQSWVRDLLHCQHSVNVCNWSHERDLFSSCSQEFTSFSFTTNHSFATLHTPTFYLGIFMLSLPMATSP